LTLTRPSASTAEILACTNKKSGKTRLTISDECNNKTESKSAVTDLWGLLPTSSVAPSTIVSTPTQTYVVDRTQKIVGVLTDTEGREGFWIKAASGNWRLSRSDVDVSGLLRPVHSTEGPLFNDDTCQSPLFRPTVSANVNDERAVVDILVKGNGKKAITRRGFRISGSLIPFPKTIYGFSYSEDNQLSCSVQSVSAIADGVPKKVYKSKLVAIPKYELPLSIMEK
jgi:hypothetical protein